MMVAAAGGEIGNWCELPVCVAADGLDLAQHRLLAKIVQRQYAGYDGRQRFGNRDVGSVGDMRLVVDDELVHLRVKRPLDLRRGARELDPLMTARDRIGMEALQREPRLDLVQIALVRAEPGGELLRRQPEMVPG